MCRYCDTQPVDADIWALVLDGAGQAYFSDHVSVAEILVSYQHAIERAIAQNVLDARADGVPWSTIGDELGITRQAAQQRYGRVPAKALDLPPALDGL